MSDVICKMIGGRSVSRLSDRSREVSAGRVMKGAGKARTELWAKESLRRWTKEDMSAGKMVMGLEERSRL